MAVCHYHRDRPAIGICMRCRKVICSACCTRVDGINHCHACLKKLGNRVEAQTWGRTQAALAAVMGLVVSWVCFAALFFLLEGRLAP